ncbi:MAG TPA: alpha/beta hydrolase [Solirubrobacteraceae bacterium]|nr:alpha/beta hydrolase [Solirubrobacteraceae bacterium]
MRHPALDPQAHDLLEVMRAMAAPPIHTLSVEAARERMRAALIPPGEPLPLHRVEDVLVPTPTGELQLRLYRPSEGELPVALFFHGGGFTLNDLDTHDELCRRLASRSGWLFASLHYRRAPEHKHPAALEDAAHAYHWLLDNQRALGIAGSERALVGESSGGTIAASLTLLLRDSGSPAPTYQVLAYPMLDLVGRWPSHETHASGYSLDTDQVRWFLGHFMPAGFDTSDPYLFPLRALDVAGLPPTLVMTAEFDPLRDEGIAYAERLLQAGVEVEHVHAGDQMHGFLMLSRAVDRAAQLIDELADHLAARRR